MWVKLKRGPKKSGEEFNIIKKFLGSVQELQVLNDDGSVPTELISVKRTSEKV